MRTVNKIRLTFVAVILLGMLYAASASAQTYRVQGDSLVRVDTKAKAQPVKTGMTITIKGKAYEVYKGSRGGYYVNRVSKKSGKAYKQYIKIEGGA